MFKLYLKNIQHLIGVALLAIGMQGCNYLDVVPDNIATIDYAFRDRASSEKFLFTCYSYLPQQGNVQSDPAMLGGGEFYTAQGLNQMNRANLGIITGKVSLGNIPSNFWDGGLYKGIRDCNIFLEKINMPYDITPAERSRWIAEVKFLKAFYHFYLMRLYGPITIVDKNLPVSTPQEVTQAYRTPFDDCVTYVSNLFDECTPDLPLKIQKEATELGRITQPIAMACKAKLLAMAASPLFNGNTVYAGEVDNRGVKLFNTTYDPAKWDKAAQACKEAIDIAHEATHKLYYPSNIPFVLNDTLNRQYSIRQVLWDKWNTETIWGGNKHGMSYLQTACMPYLEGSWRTNYGVRQNLSPTFQLAERYYTHNGVPMSEDKLLADAYANKYKTRVAKSTDKWYIKEGHETAILNFDREPRFYASIGFDGGIWWGNGRTDIKQELYSIYSKDDVLTSYSRIGYYTKKLISFETIVPPGTDAGINVQFAPFPLIRLADLYLLYAEALNEKKTTPDAEVYEYIDEVRKRAGLEGVVQSWQKYSKFPDKPLGKDGMRNIIQDERVIELAMEGQAMYDIRRWKRGTDIWNENIKGWNGLAETTEEYYTFVKVDEMKFTQKNYLWPISEYDLTINKNLKQNYGW